MRRLCWLILLLGILATLASWLVSLPMAQNWAAARAAPDPYAQFEARGFAEAALWMVRCLAAAIVLIAIVAMRHERRLQDQLLHAARALATVTCIPRGRCSPATSAGVAAGPTVLLRLSLAASCLVALVQGFTGITDRMRDWPVYRCRSGAEVLPNMSESNREVIRYLEYATPDDARILVVSDQKLFFLSYYLLPRRIFHRMHPASEFTVPQPYQQRQLAAYRLSDLSQDDIDRIDPDYVLEYFEGAEFLEGMDRMEDPEWLQFIRKWRDDPSYVPPYYVALHRRGKGRAQQ